MSLKISATSSEDLRIGVDLDTRGRPTEKASRLNAHSGSYNSQAPERFEGLSFAALLTRNRTVPAVAVATTGLAATQRPMRTAADSGELAPETVELIGKRRAAEDRPRDPRLSKPFEIERTVGAATPERDRGQQKRQPPAQQGGEPQPDAQKKRFELGGKKLGAVPVQPLAIEPISDELAEWERALLLDDEKPGTVPLIGRAPKPGGAEPVLITGRGRQRGALPTVRRASLPAPRVPASKIIATSRPLGKRVFATKVAQGGKRDPRVEPETSVRSRMVSGGHHGRL